jgi:hypothetical protein
MMRNAPLVRRTFGTFGVRLVYDDDYATCERTYASLGIYAEGLDPAEMSSLLQLSPTESHRQGEGVHGGAPLKRGFWSLSSEQHVDSRDLRRHLDWLLDQIEGRANMLRTLREQGYDMTVACYWSSADGHGGPTLSPVQTRRLANLDLELWIDFY